MRRHCLLYMIAYCLSVGSFVHNRFIITCLLHTCFRISVNLSLKNFLLQFAHKQNNTKYLFVTLPKSDSTKNRNGPYEEHMGHGSAMGHAVLREGEVCNNAFLFTRWRHCYSLAISATVGQIRQFDDDELFVIEILILVARRC